MAKGFCASLPTRVDMVAGRSPRQATRAVITIGRSLDLAMGGGRALVLKFALCSAGTGEDASPAMVQDEMQ